MKQHQLADLFPAMSDVEYQALKTDIERHGLREPIWTWRGKIIDGRHRHRACADLGVECPSREYDGDEVGALALVVSLNSSRRDLTPSQRAVIALDIEAYEAKLAKARMAEGGANKGVEKIPHLETGKARDKAAAAVGVNPRYVSDAKAIKATHPDLTEKIKRGEITLTQAKRQVKEQKRNERRNENAELIERAAAKNVAVTNVKFAAIVIDPPWDWGDEGDVDQLGRALPTYKTIPYDGLLKWPVKQRADIDAHIYLWITNRSLPKGFALLEAWGFRYITCLTWCKPSFGMGNYFRGQSEHILFGVRGSQMLKRKDVGTIFSAPRGPLGHSSKPLEFYNLVEACSPGPYLEIFGRGKPPSGWISEGADVE